MALNNSQFELSINEFGPAAAAGQFDFTPLFQDTILSLLPSTILLFLLPFRILSLHRKPRKVLGSSLHSSKLVCRKYLNIVIYI